MKRKNRLNWKYTALAAVLLIALGLGGWALYAVHAEEPGYDYLKVERGPLRVSLRESAVVQPEHRLTVTPPIPGRIDRILPAPTVTAIRQALLHFERVIPGFLRHGNLIGVETRVSSPVRFERDPATLESSLPGLYLAGEGAGYAGGIVSAGLDGLRLAETILTGTPAKRER